MSQTSTTKRTLTAKILKITAKIDYVNKLKDYVVESLIKQRDHMLNDSKGALVLDKEIESIQKKAREVLPQYAQRESVLHKYRRSIDAVQDNLKKIDDDINKLQMTHENILMQLLEKKQFIEQRLQSIDNLDSTIEELKDTLFHTQQRHDAEIAVMRQERKLMKASTVGSPSTIEMNIKQVEDALEEKERKNEAEIRQINTTIMDLKSKVTDNLGIFQNSDDNQLDAEIKKLEDMKQLATAQDHPKMSSTHVPTEEELSQGNEYNSIMRMPGISNQRKRKMMLELRNLHLTPSGRIQTRSGQLLTLEEAKRQGLVDGIDESILFAPETSSESSLIDSTTTTSASTMSSTDIHYLKTNLGRPLALALAEIAAKRPRDPIHYLGHWLIHYRYNQETDKVKKQELEEFIAERKKLALAQLRKRAEEEAKQTLADLLDRMEIEKERRTIEAELWRIEAESAANEEMEYEARDTLGEYNGPTVGQRL